MLTHFEVSKQDPRTVIESEISSKNSRNAKHLFALRDSNETQRLADILTAYRRMQRMLSKIVMEGKLGTGLASQVGELLHEVPIL